MTVPTAAMASWGAVVALTGFDYDGRSGVMRFAPKAGGTRHFWSTGDAFGTLDLRGPEAVLAVREGAVRLTELRVAGHRPASLDGDQVLSAGQTVRLELPGSESPEFGRTEGSSG